MSSVIFKALSILLVYPDARQQEYLPEVLELLRAETRLRPETRDALVELTQHLSTQPSTELQERYVGLFDRTRSLSLHLYEHLYGDSRDRGQAMVDLSSRYKEHGVELSQRELPDYLPALCEFLSLVSFEAACALLRDAAGLIDPLRRRLLRRAPDYACVLSGLLEVAEADAQGASDAAETPRQTELPTQNPSGQAEVSVEPDSLQQLDQLWEEAPITFGIGAAHDSCRTSETTPHVEANPELVQLRKSASDATSNRHRLT